MTPTYTIHDVPMSIRGVDITLVDGTVVTLEVLIRSVWDDGYSCGYEDGESGVPE
jgi:hypothetical protein